MKQKPNRPPDISIPFALASDDAVNKLRTISACTTPLTAGEAVAMIQFISGILATNCEAIALILRILPQLHGLDAVSVDPDIEEDRPEIQK